MEQIRAWEQDELKKIAQERQDMLGSRPHLDHLKRKVVGQGVHEESAGSDHVVEGNNNTFTWSGPYGVLDAPGIARKGDRAWSPIAASTTTCP
jgi:hypothetical protein